VIAREMWSGIVFVGLIMGVGTLLVVDGALPGGLIAGTGDVRYARTMAFTTLMMFQMFNVFNARSDRRSAFSGLLRNAWLWGAVALSIALQFVVLDVPFFRRAFDTVALSAGDWVVCVLVASTVLWLRELSKLLARALRPSQ
jgi:Ca2+-transporting ATPase